MLKLTDLQGDSVFVSAGSVESIETGTAQTRVCLSTGKELVVRESADAIADQVNSEMRGGRQIFKGSGND